MYKISNKLEYCHRCLEPFNKNGYCDFCKNTSHERKKDKRFNDIVWDDNSFANVDKALELEILWKKVNAVYTNITLHQALFEFSRKNYLITETLTRYKEFNSKIENNFYEDITEMAMKWYEGALIAKVYTESFRREKPKVNNKRITNMLVLTLLGASLLVMLLFTMKMKF